MLYDHENYTNDSSSTLDKRHNQSSLQSCNKPVVVISYQTAELDFNLDLEESTSLAKRNCSVEWFE